MTQKAGKIVCVDCKKPITGAKTVIDEMWHCPDCTYLHDNPDKKLDAAVKVKQIVQSETLFPLPAKRRP